MCCVCCSINGHGVPQHSLPFGLLMYTATKNAVQVLTEGLRRELVERNSKIKVTVKLTARLKSLQYVSILFLICVGSDDDRTCASTKIFLTQPVVLRNQHLFLAVAIITEIEQKYGSLNNVHVYRYLVM